MKALLSLFALFLLGAPVAAVASTIDFNGSASNLTTYSEFGYNVVATSGSWHGGGIFGNPAPSAFVDAPGGALTFSLANSGLFDFAAADLATAQAGTSMTYGFVGFLNGVQVFAQTGTNTSPGFLTFASLYPTTAIDHLRITLDSTTSSAFNVDNVVLNAATTPTPEPSTIALLGTGLLGVGGAVRRRFARA